MLVNATLEDLGNDNSPTPLTVYRDGMRAEPFTSLAGVYDRIMEDVEYEDWAEFILELARQRGWTGGAMLDVGCGTGNATQPMVSAGYEVIGVDLSEAMLDVARAKMPGVRFVRTDVKVLRLGRTFSLAFSVFDALNNLLDEADFGLAMTRVLQHLEPGGLFIFDANTTVGLRDLWEGGRVEGWVDDVYYRWIHTFDEATGLAQVEAYCETADGDFTEIHTERPYDPPQLRRLLRAAGFEDVAALSFPSGLPASRDAARVWMVARRPA